MSNYIDASNDFQARRSQNLLLDEHIQKIVDSFNQFKDEGGYSSVVSIEEIAENDFSLDISKYITALLPDKEEELVDISELLEQLNKIHERKTEVINNMNNYLKELKSLRG